MCMTDPVSVGFSLFGAATKAVGSIQGGNAEAKARQKNAGTLAALATERENKAAFDSDTRLKKAAFDIETSKRDSARKTGTVRAAIGGSGFDAQSFSEVLADDASEAALEVAAIKYNGDLDSYQIKYAGAAEARQLRSQSADQYTAAKDAKMAGWIGAASGAASSLGSIFSKPTTGSAETTSGWDFSIS